MRSRVAKVTLNLLSNKLGEGPLDSLGGQEVVQTVLAERGSQVQSVRQEVIARDQSTVEEVDQMRA